MFVGIEAEGEYAPNPEDVPFLAACVNGLLGSCGPEPWYSHSIWLSYDRGLFMLTSYYCPHF